MAELDDVIAGAASLDPTTDQKLPRPQIKASRQATNEAGVEILLNKLTKTSSKTRPLNRYPAGAVEAAFKHFENAAGNRAGLIHTLQFCPETNFAFKLVQKLIRDPQFAQDPDNCALFTACQRFGLSLTAIVLAFKDGKVAENSLKAIVKLAEEAPIVIDQVGTDAQNHWAPCPVCEGKKRVQRIGDDGEWKLSEEGVPQTQLCYNCRGKGKIFKDHDTASRKQFLQITGILDEKKGGININTGPQQIAIMKADFLPGDGGFEKLIRAIDTVTGTKRLTEAEPDVIDVTPIDVAVYDEAVDPEP